MKERDIRVVFSMITGLLAEIAALFSGYSRRRLLGASDSCSVPRSFACAQDDTGEEASHAQLSF